jgi:tRNA (guanine37-N1)-methyltransferase
VQIDVITIFPDYLAPLRLSLVGKAIDKGLITLGVHDLRDQTEDVHKTVDDSPYGGGPGMVMKPEPWRRAIEALAGPGTPRLVIPTPAGRPFTQALAQELAKEPWLVFACGRYEGIDSRVVEDARTRMRVDEVGIGDYVLAGGEVAVLVMVEAISRLLPGVLGNAESVTDDSFAPGRMEALVEGPVYTKPPVWRDRAVPEVLLSGHHGAIARWRRDQALLRTLAHRPELLDPESLDKHDRDVLAEAGFPGSSEPMAH